MSQEDQRDSLLADLDYLTENPFDKHFTVVIDNKEIRNETKLEALQKLMQSSEGDLKKFYRELIIQEKIKIKKSAKML